LIGHQGRRFHLENIVDADHVRATQDGSGDGRCGRALHESV
jgi:hypothetical protein